MVSSWDRKASREREELTLQFNCPEAFSGEVAKEEGRQFGQIGLIV